MSGEKNWKEIKNANVLPHIINYLNEQEKELVRELVPTEISLGKKQKFEKLHYSVSEVTLNAKIQDLYDLPHHPKIVNGKYPIIVNVLAPNQHVVQRTSDITSFWTNHIHRLRGNWQEDTRSMNGGKLCLEFLMICFLHMFLCQIVTFPVLVKEGVNLVSGWH